MLDLCCRSIWHWPAPRKMPQNFTICYHLPRNPSPLLHRVFFFLARRDIGGGDVHSLLAGIRLSGCNWAAVSAYGCIYA